jgi:microcystin degradation protein MlrC
LAAASEPFDGVLLILHGAMTTAKFPDAEGELLRRIREELAWRDTPVFAVLDLHVNATAAMAMHANAFFTYRENPHADAREAGCRATRSLDETLKRGATVRTAWRGTPIVWPPGGTATASGAMAELEALARRIELETPGVIEVSVCAGFSFADTPDTGVSFLVSYIDGASGIDAALDQLSARAWELREEGNVRGAPADEIVARVLREEGGPFILAEESDNIGGGAPGDGTGLLRVLLAHDARNAAVCLADPAAVQRLHGLPSGSVAKVDLGGRGSRYDAGPVALDVTVVRSTDGRFELHDKRSHLASMCGDFFDMGPSVLVEHRGLLILLTTNRTPPMDLGQWLSVGVDPRSLKLIGVKAAVAHRRAYDPIAKGNFLVETPGPCCGDLRQLDYHRIRRPIFPLDPLS